MTTTKNRSCTGKTAHPTEGIALQSAYRRRAKYGATARTTHVYKCKFCGAWHVGCKPRYS